MKPKKDFGTEFYKLMMKDQKRKDKLCIEILKKILNKESKKLKQLHNLKDDDRIYINGKIDTLIELRKNLNN